MVEEIPGEHRKKIDYSNVKIQMTLPFHGTDKDNLKKEIYISVKEFQEDRSYRLTRY